MNITIHPRTLVAFGSGLVVALVAVFVLHPWRVDASPGDTDSTFVPVPPCRLFDYRPAPNTVGDRSTALGAGEIHEQQVTGVVGNCTLPAGITAVALNVTALGGTSPSNLVVYPADVVGAPTASNLNWLPGQPPTPNKVDVKLSPDGAIKLRNAFGTVFVLGDVVGYYTDDTLQEIGQRLTALEAKPAFAGGVEMEQGIGWVSNSGNPSTVEFFENAISLDGGPLGGTAQLSLIGPVSVDGKPHQLDSVTYCVRPSPGGSVDEASIIGLAGADDTFAAETKDTTDRPADGCYTVTASPDVAARSTHHLMLFVIETVSITAVTANWVLA